MWYKEFLRIAGTKEEYLSSLGVTPDIIAWLSAVPQEYTQFYTNELRKNPSVTLQQIQSMSPPNRRTYKPSRQDIALCRNYQEPFKTWALTHLRKLHAMQIPQEKFLEDGNEHPVHYLKNETKTAFDEIYDWWRLTVPHPQISSFTLEQALYMSEEWHNMMAGRGEGEMYAPTSPESIVFGPSWPNHPEWQGWTIQQVTSQNDLACEGNHMNHCVEGYYNDVADGSARIYSLRSPQNHPVVTIEMDGEQPIVRQIKGNSNEVPDKQYRAMLKEWFGTQENITLENEDVDNIYDDIKYCNMMYLDDELDKIINAGGDYGIKNNLLDIDMDMLYNTIHDKYRKYNENYYVAKGGDSGLAEFAIKHDIEWINKYSQLYTPPKPDSEFYVNKTPYDVRLLEYYKQNIERYNKWGAIPELLSNISEHEQEFYDNQSDDYYSEPYPNEEDFYDDELDFDNEAYENAVAEWEETDQKNRESAENESRNSAFPIAFDDDILEQLKIQCKKQYEFKQSLQNFLGETGFEQYAWLFN